MMTTLPELLGLITASARTWGHKQLFCAEDVMEALSEATPETTTPFLSDSLRIWCGADVIATPDSPPGTFRLVRHFDPVLHQTSCEVVGTTVSHAKCTVIAEGHLSVPS